MAKDDDNSSYSTKRPTISSKLNLIQFIYLKIVYFIFSTVYKKQRKLKVFYFLFKIMLCCCHCHTNSFLLLIFSLLSIHKKIKREKRFLYVYYKTHKLFFMCGSILSVSFATLNVILNNQLSKINDFLCSAK